MHTYVIYMYIYLHSSSCVSLMEKLKHSQKETEKLNKQILELIKQKLDMAQQLEMWEVCLLACSHLRTS